MISAFLKKKKKHCLVAFQTHKLQTKEYYMKQIITSDINNTR